MATRDQATRERILDKAAALFAERGYQHVTVREICDAARANVAAVNYHFGDKLALYRQVVDSAIATMKETSELTVAAGRGALPEEQLRAYVRVFLGRVTTSGPPSWIHKLMAHEMKEPSELFELVIREIVEPRLRYVASVVSALSGWAPEDARVMRIVAGLQGQCLIYGPLLRFAPASWKHVVRDIDAAADHITAFTIAGIRTMSSDGASDPAGSAATLA
jgi:AcrR family transcriptional regulator